MATLCCASLLLIACAGGPAGRTAAKPAAEPGAITGVPVPAGSVLEDQGVYDDGQGIVMALYTNAHLGPEKVLQFYERQMPLLGWSPSAGGAAAPRERSFERDGVPVLIAAEAQGRGSRISILRGARGDWSFMPQMREPK